MSNPINSSLEPSFDVNIVEHALFAEQQLSEKEKSQKQKVDARRRLENKLEDLALARDIKEFDFDV